MKARIKAKLGVSDEEWATWKIGIVTSSTPRPLEDGTAIVGAVSFARVRRWLTGCVACVWVYVSR